MAATNELMIERGGQAGSAARRRANFAIFLGPAIVLTVFFFVIPVLIDIAVSFTDLSRSLRVTKFTTEQYAKIFQGDRRLPQVIGLTFVYVFGTLAIFNVTFGLILALTTTSINKVAGGFFRGVWLLPRMSPSVLYILFSCSLSRVQTQLFVSAAAEGAGSEERTAGDRTRRRRLNKLSCADWLPHDRGFVSGLPRSKDERRSGDRLITGQEGSPPRPCRRQCAPVDLPLSTSSRCCRRV
jgi:hypothetical protein